MLSFSKRTLVAGIAAIGLATAALAPAQAATWHGGGG